MVARLLSLAALLAANGCSLDGSAIRPASDASTPPDGGAETGVADGSVDSGRLDGAPDSALPDGALPDGAPDTSTMPDSGTDPDTGTGPDTSIPPDTSVPTTCGDRVLDTGERCDDGNTTSGDGCSATCDTESSYDDCPGARIVVGLGVQRYRGSNVGAASTQTCYGIGRGPDAVYTIAPSYTGRLNIRVTSPFDAVLITKSACPGSTQYFCEDRYYGGRTEQVTGGVSSSREYMVIVSGYSSSDSGPFELVFEGMPP